MKVVTEAYLRSLFRKDPPALFCLAQGQILTPSARGFLSDRHVEICQEQLPSSQTGAGTDGKKDPSKTWVLDSGSVDCEIAQADAPRPKAKYVSALDGGSFEKKPEFMTSLKGNRLVVKDHERIVFRGKLDSFQSAILLVQSGALEKGQTRMVDELEDILEWTRQIMKSDVLETPLEKESALGLTTDELRAHSHNPKKAYGVGHILPGVEMGSDLLALNYLRSLSREMEIAGVRAYYTDHKVMRPDILQALNRMSSALYIMMVREQAGFYNTGGNPDSKQGPARNQDQILHQGIRETQG